MQSPQGKQYPPLPPKNPNQSRIPMRQSSEAQASSNFLSLRPTNSQTMQNMDNSNSNFIQSQQNPNIQPGAPHPYFIHQSISNPNFQRESSNSNINQQQPNPNVPIEPSNSYFIHNSVSNPNFQKEPSNPNFIAQSPSIPNISGESSNSNFMQFQPSSNIPQLPTYPNYPQKIPTNPNYSQQVPNNNESATQTFSVIYNNTTFTVDPISLGNASSKFRELIQPYIRNPEQINQLHLQIEGNQFSNRNMNNFLRLCQKLPTDVQNNEMKEICEIAKMFNADQIYSVGINFIQNNLDQNFNVPDNKYDGSNGHVYLSLQKNTNDSNQEPDDSYFEDANNCSYQGNYHKINNPTLNTENKQISSESSEDSENSEQSENHHNLDDHSMLHDPVYSLKKVIQNSDKSNSLNTNNNENVDSEQHCENNKKEEDNADYDNLDSVIYMVRVENHTIKCPVFKFVKDGNILYTAKQKYNDVFIAEGGNIHISKKTNHVAHIYQDNVNNFNTINMKNIHFELKYVNSGRPGHYSIQVSFPYKDKVVNWFPKPPKYDPSTEKYYLNFHGEYHHTPINSSKNIVLQNRGGDPTFIVRKMTPNVFEIECLPIVDPLVVFAIGLSDIIGPYDDDWSGVNYFL